MTHPPIPHNKIALYIPYIYDDELDQLLQKVQLEEPDSYGGKGNNNNAGIMNLSRVQLFAGVGSPADEPLIAGRVWQPITRGAMGYGIRREVLASDQPCLPHNLKKRLHHGCMRCISSHACMHERSCSTCRHFFVTKQGFTHPSTNKNVLFRKKCW